MSELSIFDLMLPAFGECLVLVGIHSYLGLHVIRRKVIFVDLALAQVAALGTTVGFVFGMAPDSVAAFIFSVLFTFLAAAVFSVARLRHDRIPQEAVIGLVYAIAAAVVILVIERAPHGAEHIKEVMTGAILWVKWESILFAAVVYSIIGVVHYVFRKQFLMITHAPDKAFASGMPVRLWDFLFYLTFGVVISISVRTAGVLLVFVFLVVPAITATLMTDKLKLQLIIGWAMGTTVTIVGLGLSYVADTPSGPTVVTFYGFMLVVAAVVVYLVRRRTIASVLRVLAGAVVVCLTGLLLVVSGSVLGNSSLALSRSHPHTEVGECTAGNHHCGGHDDQDHHSPRHPEEGGEPTALRFLEVFSAAGEDERTRLINQLGDEGPARLLSALARADDEGLKLALARHGARTFGPRVGGPELVRLAREAEFPFLRSEAAAALGQLAGRRFEGFDPEADAAANEGPLLAMERWVAARAR